ncbi:MAG: hypothetical protein AAGI69_15005 [Cyanobacteria bacterium P01_H01_bin.21]
MSQATKLSKSIVFKRTLSRRATLLKSLKYSLLSGLAFLITSHSLYQTVPTSKIPENIEFIGPKYTYYQANKDNYNALFFGSSRVLNHISPAIVDQEARAHGIEINSYNLGIPAIREIHSYIFLRDVLKSAPTTLKWVFIEISLDKGYEPFANARTGRSIYWHNFSNTKIAIDYVLTSEEPLLNKAVLTTSHILPYIYHQLNVGTFFNRVLPLKFFSTELQSEQESFERNKGFLGIQSDDSNEFRQSFIANVSDYQNDVKRLKEYHKESLQVDEKSPYNKRNLIRKIVKAVNQAGATPVFIITPTLDTAEDLYEAYQEGIIPKLLAYNDPSKYPQFYELDNRHDAEHLNVYAANDFSRELARDFAQIAQTDS